MESGPQYAQPQWGSVRNNRGTSPRTFLLLGGIVLASGILGASMLTRGHDWGDDFAAYLLQARSLATGTIGDFVRGSLFSFNASSFKYGPVAAPWGFPLLLAPVYSLFGLKLLALKSVLTACYLAFLVVFFLLARTRLTQAQSLVATALLAFNPSLLQSQNSILSDLPFLFISTLSLWLIERYRQQLPASASRLAPGLVIGTSICLAAFVRPNGILLFLPLALAQWTAFPAESWRRGKCLPTAASAGLPYIVAGALYAVQAAVLPNLFYAQPPFNFSWQTSGDNVLYYLQLPWNLFGGGALGGLLYAALLALLVMGIASCKRADLPLLSYALATFLLFVAYPYQQGLRYLFPIIPVLVILAMKGAASLLGWAQAPRQTGARAAIYLLGSGLLVASIYVSGTEAVNNLEQGRSPGGGWAAGPFSPASQAMFSFLRQETPQDTKIAFFKPRAMRLLTGRDSFLTTNCTALLKADYVVLVNDDHLAFQIPPDQIAQCTPQVDLELVYRQQSFIAYQVTH